jgi:hypothetical protein
VANITDPDAVPTAVPLLNSKLPEAPAVPAFALTTRTDALEAAAAEPDATNTLPPVTLEAPVEEPANISNGPPLAAPCPPRICHRDTRCQRDQ